MKFSVIIPCYNVENFIPGCLDSVYNQDFPESEFEVIVINDGSEDNSKETAQNWLKEKINSTVISQKNKGLGGARNTGIENALGEYLIFLDADDRLLPNSLDTLSKNINNEDIIEFGFLKIQGNKTLSEHTFTPAKEDTGVDYFLKHSSSNSACNKIYRTDFLKRHSLRFKERIFGEDIEFNTRAFLYAKQVSSLLAVLIAFHQTENSITRNTSKGLKAKYLKDLSETILSISLLRNSNKKSNLEKEYLNYRLCSMNTNTLLFALKSRFDTTRIYNYLNFLKKNDALYFKSPLKDRNIYRFLFRNKVLRTIIISLNSYR